LVGDADEMGRIEDAKAARREKKELQS